MAKSDAESTATSRITAAANLFTGLAEAGPQAELLLAGRNGKLLERVRKSTRVALFRLDAALADYLADPEVASDADAIDKAQREINERLAAEAKARAPRRI